MLFKGFFLFKRTFFLFDVSKWGSLKLMKTRRIEKIDNSLLALSVNASLLPFEMRNANKFMQHSFRTEEHKKS